MMPLTEGIIQNYSNLFEKFFLGLSLRKLSFVQTYFFKKQGTVWRLQSLFLM